MEKTTVYLTAEQKAALARTAAAEGRSEARLIRAGVDVVTARHRAAEASVAPSYGGSPAAESAGPAGSTAGPGAPAPAGRPRWAPREAFARDVLRHQADPALRGELRELAPDTTEGAPLG